MNLCSKFYRDIRATEEQAAVEKSLNHNKPKFHPQLSHEIAPGIESGSSSSTSCGGELAKASLEPPKSTRATRCLSCNKKVGVMGFECKCGSTFCGAHRYPENHKCKFDFKGAAKDAIAKANLVVKADKVDRI